MAAKKRAPRQVWIVMRDSERHIPAAATTRSGARALVDEDGEYVIGPYVLAERAGQR